MLVSSSIVVLIALAIAANAHDGAGNGAAVAMRPVYGSTSDVAPSQEQASSVGYVGATSPQSGPSIGASEPNASLSERLCLAAALRAPGKYAASSSSGTQELMLGQYGSTASIQSCKKKPARVRFRFRLRCSFSGCCAQMDRPALARPSSIPAACTANWKNESTMAKISCASIVRAAPAQRKLASEIET